MNRFILIFFLSVQAMYAQDATLKNLVKTGRKQSVLTAGQLVRAEQLLKDCTNKALVADAYVLLGKTYDSLEQYDESYTCFSKANKLIPATAEHSEDKGDVLSRIGGVLLKTANYGEAYRFFSEAKAIYQRGGHKRGVINEQGNCAVALVSIGKTDKAIRLLTALLHEDLRDDEIATAYMTLGNIYLISNPKDPEKAVNYYLQGLPHAHKPKLKAFILQNLAESYIALKQYDKADFYNKQAIPFTEKSNSYELQSTRYLFESKIAESRRNFDEAYEKLRLYQHYINLADTSVMREKILRSQANEEIVKQRRKLMLRQQQLSRLEKLQLTSSIRTAGLFVLFLLAVGLSARYIMKYRKRVLLLNRAVSDTAHQLEFNKVQLDKITLDVRKDIRFNNRVYSDLKEIQRKISDPNIKSQFGSLLGTIHQVNESETREVLLLQADTGFIYRLNKRFPFLTEEEKQICALLYLHQKNKEIAQLLNLSVRSVENSRYRIRKKIGLSTTDNLSNYIQTI